MTTPNAVPPATIDYFSIETYQAAAEYIKSKLSADKQQPEVMIICGSGLGGLADTLTEQMEFEYKDIPNFAISTVAGHAGKLVFGYLAGKLAVCMVGRKHAYEGHSLLRTVFPVRVMKLLGVHTVIVTNAAGGLNNDFKVADIMVIQDHLSLPGMSGVNALVGPNLDVFGPRFPAVSDAYDYNLRLLAFKASQKVGIPAECMQEGVYCMVAGPSYESRAEARNLRNMGGDAVGMSTVPEVIVARHAGMRVLGLSLITNHVNQSHGKSAKAEAFAALNAKKTTRTVTTTTTTKTDDKGNKTTTVVTTTTTSAAEGADNATDSASSAAGGDAILVNHQEVLETSALRSKDMQELVKTIVKLM
ncbi:nucleoside phosphorylase domain-containing protein [Chytriomyces sp. MP71]|nr:nucleoside phosphorylase domain-containing protein [Chytriomyces sp. MP71]